MKITIEDLDNEAFNRLALAERMAAALWDFDQHLHLMSRGKIAEQGIEKLYEVWREAIYGINFDDIWR